MVSGALFHQKHTENVVFGHFIHIYTSLNLEISKQQSTVLLSTCHVVDTFYWRLVVCKEGRQRFGILWAKGKFQSKGKLHMLDPTIQNTVCSPHSQVHCVFKSHPSNRGHFHTKK
jgi:hypothetical protein